MKLSISIMCHPKRAQYLPYLFDRLGQVPVALDEKNNIVDTCIRAWKLYMPSAEYHCVIQDDAIVCDHFRERAEMVLTDPALAYQFYYGNRIKEKKQREQALAQGFADQDVVRWGVAICLPTKNVLPMLDYISKLHDPQDDERITKYLKSIGMKVRFPIPSLVDHRFEEKSLVGNAHSPGRRAFWFIENSKPKDI